MYVYEYVYVCMCMSMLCVFMQRDNKQLRGTIMRLERENDNLAQELVASKVTLRAEMDKARFQFPDLILTLLS